MRPEPTARVTLSTSKGDIEIELFAKQLPKSCRAFLRNCISKRYNGLQFDTVGASFIQSQKLNDNSEIQYETHSRLKWEGRGCVGLLSHEGSRSSSADGFFIALKPPNELHTSHVYIGKVAGDSIYTALDIASAEKKPDSDEPLYPISIVDTVVQQQFFEDLVPAPLLQETQAQEKKKTNKRSLTLDYGDDDSDTAVEFEMKSAHETLKRTKVGTVDRQETLAKTSTGLHAVSHAAATKQFDGYLDLSDDNLDAKELELHDYKPLQK